MQQKKIYKSYLTELNWIWQIKQKKKEKDLVWKS